MQFQSSPRKARCWRVAKSASSSASDARCAVFSASTAVTRRANSRCNGMGGTGTRIAVRLSRLMFDSCDRFRARRHLSLQSRRRSVKTDAQTKTRFDALRSTRRRCDVLADKSTFRVMLGTCAIDADEFRDVVHGEQQVSGSAAASIRRASSLSGTNVRCRQLPMQCHRERSRRPMNRLPCRAYDSSESRARRSSNCMTFTERRDRPALRVGGRVAEEVEEEGLGEGVELGEGGAALGPQRLRPVQHLRYPPLLRQRRQGDFEIFGNVAR